MKELYIKIVDELAEHYMAAGMDETAAYDRAGNEAYTQLGERIADYLDHEYSWRKDQQLMSNL